MPLSGGTITGSLTINTDLKLSNNRIMGVGGSTDFYIWNGSGGILSRADSGFHVKNNNNTAYVGIAASDFVKASSIKVKENIKDITDEETKKILDINIVSFDYKKNFGNQKNNYGVIAEEVQKILPYAVFIPDNYNESEFDESKGTNQPILSVDYSKFVPHLIKMTQIQQSKINKLEERLSKLEK